MDSETNIPRRNALGTLIGAGAGLSTSLLSGAQIASATPPATPPASASVNVLDFGADPSGLTDSQPSIQQAIDYVVSALSIGTGAVYIPAGVYRIDRPIRMKGQLRLHGDGYWSVLRCNFGPGAAIPSWNYAGAASPAPAYPPMLYTDRPSAYMLIEGLQFNGNLKDCYGLWFRECHSSVIRNVWIYKTNKRACSNYYGLQFMHDNLQVQYTGDGVACLGCMMFTFISCGWNFVGGPYSLQWNMPSSGAGGLNLQTCWFESSSDGSNTVAHLGISGSGVNGRVLLFSNGAGSGTTPQCIHCFDHNESVTLDGLTSQRWRTSCADLTQIMNGGLPLYLGALTIGVAISGHDIILNRPDFTGVIDASGNTGANATQQGNRPLANIITTTD